MLTPIQKQRVKSLVYWVKDQVRVGRPLSFADDVEAPDLREMLAESLERERRRKEQKKDGESYLDSTFNTKLKSTAQWEKWLEELETTLCQIIGSKGVPLSYVIRTEEAAVYDETKTYDENVTQAQAHY